MSIRFENEEWSDMKASVIAAHQALCEAGRSDEADALRDAFTSLDLDEFNHGRKVAALLSSSRNHST